MNEDIPIASEIDEKDVDCLTHLLSSLLKDATGGRYSWSDLDDPVAELLLDSGFDALQGIMREFVSEFLV